MMSSSFARTTEPARPSTSAPAAAFGNDGFEIPPDAFDAVDAGHRTAGVVTCPHCTFENPVGRTDCEVCGLPL
jgi:nuclear protein localization family protein 4